MIIQNSNLYLLNAKQDSAIAHQKFGLYPYYQKGPLNKGLKNQNQVPLASYVKRFAKLTFPLLGTQSNLSKQSFSCFASKAFCQNNVLATISGNNKWQQKIAMRGVSFVSFANLKNKHFLNYKSHLTVILNKSISLKHTKDNEKMYKKNDTIYQYLLWRLLYSRFLKPQKSIILENKHILQNEIRNEKSQELEIQNSNAGDTNFVSRAQFNKIIKKKEKDILSVKKKNTQFTSDRFAYEVSPDHRGAKKNFIFSFFRKNYNPKFYEANSLRTSKNSPSHQGVNTVSFAKNFFPYKKSFLCYWLLPFVGFVFTLNQQIKSNIWNSQKNIDSNMFTIIYKNQSFFSNEAIFKTSSHKNIISYLVPRIEKKLSIQQYLINLNMDNNFNLLLNEYDFFLTNEPGKSQINNFAILYLKSLENFIQNNIQNEISINNILNNEVRYTNFTSFANNVNEASFLSRARKKIFKSFWLNLDIIPIYNNKTPFFFIGPVRNSYLAFQGFPFVDLLKNTIFGHNEISAIKGADNANFAKTLKNNNKESIESSNKINSHRASLVSFAKYNLKFGHFICKNNVGFLNNSNLTINYLNNETGKKQNYNENKKNRFLQALFFKQNQVKLMKFVLRLDKTPYNGSNQVSLALHGKPFAKTKFWQQKIAVKSKNNVSFSNKKSKKKKTPLSSYLKLEFLFDNFIKKELLEFKPYLFETLENSQLKKQIQDIDKNNPISFLYLENIINNKNLFNEAHIARTSYFQKEVLAKRLSREERVSMANPSLKSRGVANNVNNFIEKNLNILKEWPKFFSDKVNSQRDSFMSSPIKIEKSTFIDEVDNPNFTRQMGFDDQGWPSKGKSANFVSFDNLNSKYKKLSKEQLYKLLFNSFSDSSLYKAETINKRGPCFVRQADGSVNSINNEIIIPKQIKMSPTPSIFLTDSVLVKQYKNSFLSKKLGLHTKQIEVKQPEHLPALKADQRQKFSDGKYLFGFFKNLQINPFNLSKKNKDIKIHYTSILKMKEEKIKSQQKIKNEYINYSFFIQKLNFKLKNILLKNQLKNSSFFTKYFKIRNIKLQNTKEFFIKEKNTNLSLLRNPPQKMEKLLRTYFSIKNKSNLTIKDKKVTKLAKQDYKGIVLLKTSNVNHLYTFEKHQRKKAFYNQIKQEIFKKNISLKTPFDFYPLQVESKNQKIVKLTKLTPLIANTSFWQNTWRPFSVRTKKELGTSLPLKGTLLRNIINYNNSNYKEPEPKFQRNFGSGLSSNKTNFQRDSFVSEAQLAVVFDKNHGNVNAFGSDQSDEKFNKIENKMYSPRFLIKNRSIIVTSISKQKQQADTQKNKGKLASSVNKDPLYLSSRSAIETLDPGHFWEKEKLNNSTLLINSEIKKTQNEINLEKQRKYIQKKRRRKKLKKETRRRKKRKRFYPRPSWLRYRSFIKFLNKRKTERKINRDLYDKQHSQIAFSNKRGFYNEANSQFLASPYSIVGANRKDDSFVSFAKENKREKLLRKYYPFSYNFSPLYTLTSHTKWASLFNTTSDHLVTKVQNNDQPIFLNYSNGATHKGNSYVSYANLYEKNEKYYKEIQQKSENLFSMHITNKDNFIISRSILVDFKRLLWKSYWLRSNLNPYLKRVRNFLMKIKESKQKWEFFKNLNNFLNYMGGFNITTKFSAEMKNPGKLNQWENTLYFAEYNRITYYRIQEFISQIRENFATLLTNKNNIESPTLQTALKKDNSLRDTQSVLSVPFGSKTKDSTFDKMLKAKEPSFSNKKFKKTKNLLKVRSSHLSHSKMQDNKRHNIISRRKTTDFWVKLGKAVMADNQSNSISGGAASQAQINEQTYFKKHRGWGLLPNYIFYNSKTEPTNPQIRIIWALSKITPSLNSHLSVSDGLINRDPNNKQKTNINSFLYKRRKTWSASPESSKFRDQIKYNKTKKMYRDLSIKFQTLLNEQNDFLFKFDPSKFEPSLLLKDRTKNGQNSSYSFINQRDSIPGPSLYYQRYETGTNVAIPKGNSNVSFVSFNKTLSIFEKRFLSEATQWLEPALNNETHNINVSNNVDKNSFEPHVAKTSLQESLNTNNLNGDPFLVSFGNVNINFNNQLLNKLFKKVRQKEDKSDFLNKNKRSSFMMTKKGIRLYKKMIQINKNNTSRLNQTSEFFTKEQSWFNNLTNKTSFVFWWTIYTNKFKNILNFLSQKEELSYPTPISYRNENVLSKINEAIRWPESALNKSAHEANLQRDSFVNIQKEQNEYFLKTAWICSLLFHFCSILSLISFSQIRDLLKFYLLGISKIYKISLGILEYIYNSYYRFKIVSSSMAGSGHRGSAQKASFAKDQNKVLAIRSFDRISLTNEKKAYLILDKIIINYLNKPTSINLIKNFNIVSQTNQGQTSFLKNYERKNQSFLALKILLNKVPGVKGARFVSLSNPNYKYQRNIWFGFFVAKDKNKVLARRFAWEAQFAFLFFIKNFIAKIITLAKQNKNNNKYFSTSYSGNFVLAKRLSREARETLYWQQEGKNNINLLPNIKNNKSIRSINYKNLPFYFKNYTILYSLFFLNCIIKNIYGFTVGTNILLKQSFELIGRFGPKSIFNFLEKPGELIIDWIAYMFLVEWSSDMTNTIPENVDIYLGTSYYKFIRTYQSLNFLNVLQSLNFYQKSMINNVTPLLAFNYKDPTDIIKDNFYWQNLGTEKIAIPNLNLSLLNLASTFIQNRIYHLYEILLFQFYQPDSDLIVRQKKGIIFWDIWGDFLMQVAEDSNINISELTSLKEEQIKLLEKSLLVEMKQPVLAKNKHINLLKNKKIKTNFASEVFPFLAKLKNNKIPSLFKDGSSVFDPKDNRFNSVKAARFMNFTKAKDQNKVLAIRSSYFTNKFIINHNIFNLFKLQHTRINDLDFHSFGKEAKIISDQGSNQRETNNFVAQQFLSYQGKDTELFIDLHPPKSFTMISLLKKNESVQTSIGSLVCQIFSGIMSKQISKNILVVGKEPEQYHSDGKSLFEFFNTNQKLSGFNETNDSFRIKKQKDNSDLYKSSNVSIAKNNQNEKTLLIQAIAGETELKIITDNAYRYAMVYRGVAVGIKLLRDVFDSLSLHTPCLFLIEDIHAIGERRPLLISDDEKGSSPNGKPVFGSQREEIHEKNQVLYQLSKHVISHYRKPYKGDFSLLIPTNHFCFDLFKPNLDSFNINKINPSSLSFPSPKIFVQSKSPNDSNQILNDSSSSTINASKSNKEKNLYKSRLLIKSSQLFAPPATSPFSVLNLKEQKKFQPYKIVSEMPWGTGLRQSSEQLAQLSKTSYSIRVKVAVLADMAISTLSVKLDMITDLLVIIDSVKGNRGFVVFATTHIPYILDPALRRPGRLDETITLGLFPNLVSRWNILKSSFGLFIAGKQQTGFRNGLSLDLTYSIQYSSLSYLLSSVFYSPKNSSVQLFSNKNQIFKNKNISKFLFSQVHKTSSLHTSYCQNQNMVKSFANNAGVSLFKAYNFRKAKNKLGLNKREIASYVSLGPDFQHKVSKFVNFVNNKQEKYNQSFKNNCITTNKEPEPNFFKEKIWFGFTNQKKYSNNKKSIKILSQTYFVASNFLYEANINKVSSQYSFVSFANTNFTNEKNVSFAKKDNFLDFLQPLNIETSLLYISLYTSPQQFQNSIIKLMSGKLGEIFLFSNIKNNLYRKPQTNISTKSLVLPLKNKNQIIKQNSIKNMTDFTSFGLSNSWKILSSLILSFVQKRYLYNNNLIIPKFLDFNNKNSSCPKGEVPSPPSSNIFLPARRYENYRRSFAFFAGRNASIGIMEKIQTHQQQRLIKRLYGFSVKETFKSEVLENRYTSFTNANLMIGSFSSLLQKPSNSNWFFKNRILMRHKNYLTNQWWTAQLPEHNAETTFLSDIDWRYTFVELIGDLLLDFPDADQHYNPKNRRWLLTKGDYHNWFNFEKNFYNEIYTHFIFNSFIKAYNLFENNREVLDFYAFYILQKGLYNYHTLNEFEIIKLYKRFL